MRKLLFSLCLFVSCGLLSIAGRQDVDIGTHLSEQEKVILKVFELPDPKSSSPFQMADMKVLKAFNEKFPYIELRAFSGIKIEGQSMDSKPLMAIAGGVSADVLYVNFRQSDTYIQNGFLYPMDEYMTEMTDEDKELRIPDPFWPVIKRSGPAGKEHVWALPSGAFVRVLTYRKDLFQKVGLDPNHPPETWGEMLEYARRMTLPKEGTYGVLFSMGLHTAWDLTTFIWSAGGDAVKLDPETGRWTAVFNSEGAIDALEFYLQLVATRWTDSDGNEHMGYACREDSRVADQLWNDGKIGMRLNYMSEEGMGRKVDPYLYGMAPVPLSWKGMRSSELNSRMMGIFSKAGEKNNSGMGNRDPVKVKRAAWEYIKFFDSEEARTIRVKSMVEAGYGKLQNPLYLERYGYTEYLKYTDPTLIKTFNAALKNGNPEPYGRNCQLVYTFMSYPMEDCLALDKKGELGTTRKERRENIGKILDAAVERTNEEMIGYVSPQTRKFRNRVAAVVGSIIVLAFIFILRKVWDIFTPKDGPIVHGWLIKKYFWAYVMLVPALGSILLWKYLPIIMGSIMAFQDYRIVGTSEWIGLQNFADVIFDPMWWSAIGKTLKYMTIMLSIGFVPPIILAILLQEVSHGKVIYRVIYYLPAVITGVIVVYLWKLLYDPSDAGGLNQILMAIGLEKKEWLQDEALAMLCCVIPMVWAGMGPGCLIYLAALKGIPDDNYEAADLDGATFLQKVRHIVIPNLKALVIIQFIAAFIAASQQSGMILVMTFGGPNEATKVAGLKIFETAYMYLKFGMATTMAWMLGVMLMGFTVLQLRKLSNMEFKSTGDT